MRSLRGSEGRSRSLLDRSGPRPTRSLDGGGGGGGGAGARSPGLMPALSAAAVGRNTLTWREGGGGGDGSGRRRWFYFDAVGWRGGGFDRRDRFLDHWRLDRERARLRPRASSTTSGAGASARVAGVNFLTRRAGIGCFAARRRASAAELRRVRRRQRWRQRQRPVPVRALPARLRLQALRASAATARFTTLTARLTAVSFFGKYLFRIFSASSLETEFDGTLTSTPSRRTSSMSRFVSSFSSLARS